MKKLLITSTIVCVAFIASAQKATIDQDTVTYMGKSYHLGDTLQLGYGSGNNKDFAFVQMGSAMTGTNPLKNNWSKSEFVVDKVYKFHGKCYLRGKTINSGATNLLGGNKVFVDVEGAVDNNELKPRQ
jgi:hypothetical protein